MLNRVSMADLRLRFAHPVNLLWLTVPLAFNADFLPHSVLGVVEPRHGSGLICQVKKIGAHIKFLHHINTIQKMCNTTKRIKTCYLRAQILQDGA